MAFKTASLMGFREAYEKAGPTILEPIMRVEIDAPTEFQGAVVGQVNQRRGVILETIAGDSASVDGPREAGSDAAWLDELDRRVDAAKGRGESGADWSDVRSRILKRLGRT